MSGPGHWSQCWCSTHSTIASHTLTTSPALTQAATVLSYLAPSANLSIKYNRLLLITSNRQQGIRRGLVNNSALCGGVCNVSRDTRSGVTSPNRVCLSASSSRRKLLFCPHHSPRGRDHSGDDQYLSPCAPPRSVCCLPWPGWAGESLAWAGAG